MFGSDFVAPYIGELWIVNKADSFLKDGKLAQELANKMSENPQTTQIPGENAQRKHQVVCAMNLRNRISSYVDMIPEDPDKAAIEFVLMQDAGQSTDGVAFMEHIGERQTAWQGICIRRVCSISGYILKVAGVIQNDPTRSKIVQKCSISTHVWGRRMRKLTYSWEQCNAYNNSY